MDKRIQDARDFVTDEDNRIMVIATTVGVIAAVAVAVFAAKQGKKRK